MKSVCGSNKESCAMLKMTSPSSRRSCSSDKVWHHHPLPVAQGGMGSAHDWPRGCTGHDAVVLSGFCKAGNVLCLGRKDAGGLLGEQAALQRGWVGVHRCRCVWPVPPGSNWKWSLEILKCLSMVGMSSMVVYLLNYIDPECAVYWLLVKYVPLIIQKTALV